MVLPAAYREAIMDPSSGSDSFSDLAADGRQQRGSGPVPGDIPVEAPEATSMSHRQSPILTGHDGGCGETTDALAYALVVEACETALRTLCVSESCAAILRRSASSARRAGGLPPRELRQVVLREAG